MSPNEDERANQPSPVRKKHRLAPEIYANSAYQYFFTVCARHQGQHFLNAALAQKVIESLLWTRNRYGWHLYCCCLMPHHLHFVCRLPEQELKLVNAGARGVLPEGVLDHLSRFKSFTTNASWKLGFSGSLWQKSSYDRVMDMAWPLEEIIEYVLNNPVRKALTRIWNEWPYSMVVDSWQ